MSNPASVFQIHSSKPAQRAGCIPQTQFITGPAGTGKTFEVRRRIDEDPHYGIVCATTGIAAVNLESITVNSLLGYFDTAAMRDRYTKGLLAATLAQLRRTGCENLIVDEVSMMDARQLDLLFRAAQDSSRLPVVAAAGGPIGILLTGDFCQLPPVNAPWAFQAQCWPRFENNNIRLEKFWRQRDGSFLQALAYARQGAGKAAVELLRSRGVEFTGIVDKHWDGTTIFARNAGVEQYNLAALRRLTGRTFKVESVRWGRQRPEWVWDPTRVSGIRNEMTLKLGALVMLLSNDTPALTYVNGDLGHIEEYHPNGVPGAGTILVRVKRTGNVVAISRINRRNTQLEPPVNGMKPPVDEKQAFELEMKARQTGKPFYSWREGKWVIGEITYFPLRLGYASTVHKSQGLTLDHVQIDCRDDFFGEPNMAYVALSRCRRPEGLRVVGTPELLAKRIRVAAEVMRWL